jgi:peptidoglycan/LPS O-acetylase OafA/YrhL
MTSATQPILADAAPGTVPVRNPEEPSRFRIDIQLLRAWAVGIVVLNHARIPFFQGGFLGVDIFFVISGFLITGIIEDALDSGRFRFRDFYLRRARRLLPAAYATFTVTALAAPLLLDGTEYRSFLWQLVGSFGFFANVVLWKQVDYFGSGAALKPLLHVWSLSLEEQYYLVLPLALFLCPKRFRLALASIALVGSGLLCVAVMGRSVSAAFYLLPTRAWELMIGSVTILLVRRNAAMARPMTLARFGCAAILGLTPLIATEEGHPGLPALLVCLATAILLVPGARLERGDGWLRPAVAIGNRSYSLYLVHWPLFAFANNILLREAPLWLDVALLAVTLLLADAQYRWIERRYHYRRKGARGLAALLSVPILAIGLSAGLATRPQGPAMLARAGGSGLAPACDFRGDFQPLPECTTGRQPDTLVWGDSFAMALAPGMAAAAPNGIVQATRTVCGPLLDLAPVNGALYNANWAARCMAFNDSVIAYLARTPGITTIVLTSSLAQYVPGAEDQDWRYLLRRPGGRLVETPQDARQLLSVLAGTVARLHALGKRVLFVAPPPSSAVDVARCSERLAEGRPTIGANPGCAFTVADYHAYRRDIRAFVQAVTAEKIAPVMDFASTLCPGQWCAAQINGTPLYRDKDHLSADGSIALSRIMNWRNTLATNAR